MLANLTDEDGALAELEDLEHLADWLVDGPEEENKIILNDLHPFRLPMAH
jgi:hypothetical protein